MRKCENADSSAALRNDNHGNDKQKESGGSVCEQDGDAVDDGIAPVAAGAMDGVCRCVEDKGLVADRADQPAEVFGVEGGLRRLSGHGSSYRVQGSRFEVGGARYHESRYEKCSADFERD